MKETHALTLGLAAALVSLGTGVAIIGCSGGSSGGGGIAPVSSAFVPDNPDPPDRLETALGTAVTESLQDNKVHLYEFPVQVGSSFDVQVSTSSATASLYVRIEEFNASGSPIVIFEGGPGRANQVTSPFTMPVSPTTGTKIRIHVADEAQASVTATVSSRQTSTAFNESTFNVAVTLAGDDTSWVGYGFFNDLQTAADKRAFYDDLIARVNTILQSSGIQINVGASDVFTISAATVQAAEPGLVSGGETILDSNPNLTLSAASHPSRWGNLGFAESDPNHGLSLEIFLVGQVQNGDKLGTSNGFVPQGGSTVPIRNGGIFKGRGQQHSVVAGLFDRGADPITPTTLATVVAHEIGHFLSLRHPADAVTLTQAISQALYQGITTSEVGAGFFHLQFYRGLTPSTPADDKNGNGTLEWDATMPSAPDRPLPDENNVMFLVADPAHTAWSAGQARAMSSYLAITEH